MLGAEIHLHAGVNMQLPQIYSTYLRIDPVFAIRRLSLEYTFGPCRDVSSTVVCIALKYKLPFASLTRLQGPKRHAI